MSHLFYLPGNDEINSRAQTMARDAPRRPSAALPVGLQFDPDNEIRKHVEGGEPVEKVASLNAVHAAENHVAFRLRLGAGQSKCRASIISDYRRRTFQLCGLGDEPIPPR